jgi:23S rRNA pseudouridine1911/1915/1917 synthase
MAMMFFHERWPVFHEDNHLLAVYKPAGLLAQADEPGGHCLLELARDWIKQRHNKPGRAFLGLVHRLDRPVAGVMVLARTSKAAARLSEQLRTRAARKRYLAVVENTPGAEAGRLVHHIERTARFSRVLTQPSASSREARLGFRVLEAAEGRSLLEVELETGRRHQIRLQLAHVGCPVVGDVRYGASQPLGCRQIALFARQLTLEHPTLRHSLTFTSPLPAGWPWRSGEPPEQAPLWNWEEFSTGRFTF